MEFPLPRRGGVTVALGVLLVTGAAFAFYFFHYVGQRSEYLRQRNLRELAMLARQIEDAVATWDEVAWNYARTLPDLEELAQRLDPEELAGQLDELGLAPDPHRFGEPGWYRIREGVLAGGKLHRIDPADEPEDGPPPWLTIHPQGKINWLCFRVESSGGVARFVHLRLSRLLGPLTLPEQFFDHLLLLDDRGRILFRRTGPTLKLARLTLENGEGLSTRSQHRTLEIAGRSFELFTQPVTVRPSHQNPDDETPPGSWAVAGLVRAERLTEESGAVSPLALLVMLCVFLLLLLLVPVLKVRSLAPHERLRRRDLVGLAVASTFAVALLTLLVADLWAYRSMAQAVDESLEQLSEEIETHLVAEIRALQDQLLELATDDPPLGPESTRRANLLSRGADGWPYPWFHSAFWIDTNGTLVSRWTVEADGRASQAMSVAERSYFQNASAKRLWYLEAGDRPGFVLEPVRSLTTGTQVTVLAMPDPERPGAVRAIETELMSVTRPVVPTDIGFALVDPEGRTVFHSDPARNGQEDLLAACDESPRLLSVLRQPGTTALFDAPYQGRPHRLHVRQIQSLPLWLVVFHSRDPLYRLHLDLMLWILAATVVFLLVLAVLAFLLGGLWIALDGGDDWLIGSGERYEQSDLKLAGVLALLAATLVWSLMRSDLLSKLIFATSVPLIAIFFILARLVWKRTNRRRRTLDLIPLALWLIALVADLGFSLRLDLAIFRPDLLVPTALFALTLLLWLRPSPKPSEPRWAWVAGGGGVVANTLLYFLVVAALPTGLLFQVVWHVEWWSLVARGQRHLAEQFENRGERVQTAFGRERMDIPTGTREELLQRRLALAGGVGWDRYEEAFFATEAYEERGCPVSTGGLLPERVEDGDGDREVREFGPWLWKRLEGLHQRLPLQEQRTLEEASDGLTVARQWSWRGDLAKGNVRLHAVRPDRDLCRHLITPGTPPRRLQRLGAPLVLVLGGLFLLGAIGITARRLLVLDLGEGHPAEDLPELGNHLLWTALPETAQRTFPPDSETVWLDVEDPDDWKTVETGDRSRLEGAFRVVFQNVEMLFDEPSRWRRLLAFGETLAREQGCSLVLLSEVYLEPETVLAASEPAPDNEGDNADGEPTELSRERARAFLSQVTICSFEEIGESSDEDREDGAARSRWLREEAGRHPRLRRGAAWLAGHPKLPELSRRQVEDLFEEALAFYYAWLWERSSSEEKRLLFQLAEEGLMNPRARDAARRLLRRGLIERNPNRGMQLMNRSFRRWVQETGAAEDIQALESAPGGWRDVRTPVYLALAAMLLFLLTTQQDLFTGTLGQLQQSFVQMVTVLTALAGGLAGLTRLLARFSGGS